jgi:hypothetical protein
MIQSIEGGAREMAPGEGGIVQAFLLVPDGIGVPVVAGTQFELREGAKVVAHGTVKEYLDS